MKTADFLKKYSARNSNADVILKIYYDCQPVAFFYNGNEPVAGYYSRNVRESETFGITRYEVEHFGELEWPVANSTLIGFEIDNGVEGR